MQSAGSALERVSTTFVFLVGGFNSRVAVWRRVRAGLSDLSVAVVKDVVPLNGKALVVGIEVSDNSTVDIVEVSVLNKNLRALAGVDAGGRDVLVAAGVDVTSTEAERWAPGVHVVPVVVVVSHAEVTTVLAAVAGGVADQGTLPLNKM